MIFIIYNTMYIKIYYYGNKYVMNTINHRLVSLSYCLKSDVTKQIFLAYFLLLVNTRARRLFLCLLFPCQNGTLSPVCYLGQL